MGTGDYERTGQCLWANEMTLYLSGGWRLYTRVKLTELDTKRKMSISLYGNLKNKNFFTSL